MPKTLWSSGIVLSSQMRGLNFELKYGALTLCASNKSLCDSWKCISIMVAVGSSQQKINSE